MTAQWALDDHRRQLLRHEGLAFAMRRANEHIVQCHDRPARRIAGLALTAGNTWAHPGLIRLAAPVPLIAEHEEIFVLGRVDTVRFNGKDINFTATICNAGDLSLVEQVWADLIFGKRFGVSIGLHEPTVCCGQDRLVNDGRLTEISLCAAGRDPNARITRIWQRNSVVSLRGPAEITWYAESKA